MTTSSYRQDGRLLEVNENTDVQSTGNGIAVNPRAELELLANDRHALDAALIPGTYVTVSFNKSGLDVTPARDQSRDPMHY